jgi:uncharacterized protein (DUF885 family)
VTVSRRDFVRAGATIAAAAAAAPLLSCKLEDRRELADLGFARLRDRYFKQQLELNPVTSTYLGGDGWDPTLRALNGRLRDYSIDALHDEARSYREFDRGYGAVDPSLLRPAERIDYAVIGAQVAFLKYQLDRRYHERSVDTYVAEPFRGVDWQIQQMQAVGPNQLGTEEEWRLVVERVSVIPAYLQVARANLEAGRRSGNRPDGRMVQRDGIVGSRASAAYFRTSLPTLGSQSLGTRQFANTMFGGLSSAGAAAARAYEEFANWLTSAFPATDTTDRFALGESAYEWRVHNVLRDDRSAAELFDYGDRQVQDYTQRVAEVAERIARERGIQLPFASDEERAWSIRRVIDDLSGDSPSSDDELFLWYRETAARAVAYGRDQQMFAVPADYQLDIVPTPPMLRSTIDAAYYPAPPLKHASVGRFYLTPTGNDPAALRLQNRASIADTAVHEGFPGHDWHFKYMTENAARISNVRWLTPGAVEDSSSMWSDSMATEGWGLYAEELMAQSHADHPYGFYSPAEYMYELQGQLLRAVRVHVDVGIHTGRMTYDDAVNYYTEHVSFFPNACAQAARDPQAKAICDEAQRAIYRYSKWPTQAITYNLGKNAIVDLREAYRTRRGSAYSPREFHERLMQMGTIPAGYFKDVFLGNT